VGPAEGEVPAGCTLITVPSLGGISRDDPLVDAHGRCRWQASEGQAPTKLATPRWPAGGAVAAAHRRQAMLKIDELHRELADVERWMATPRLALIRDRTAERDAILAKIATIATALEG